MKLDGPEALGLVAGFIGAFAFAPQAFKILRDRQAQHVSLLSYLMIAAGAGLWAIYGLWRAAPSIVIWNLVALGLASAVVILKLRHPGEGG